MNALAARGDLVLENDRVRLVLDALDAPHYLAPTGGTMLDFVPKGGTSDDELNQIFQATGILPATRSARRASTSTTTPPSTSPSWSAACSTVGRGRASSRGTSFAPASPVCASGRSSSTAAASPRRSS
ncbi:MAG: hypothetical protein IPK71_20015 [Myxococcales bacterium]|nr:hypothetical protein [Myxococcales bacterium]